MVCIYLADKISILPQFVVLCSRTDFIMCEKQDCRLVYSNKKYLFGVQHQRKFKIKNKINRHDIAICLCGEW